MGVSTKTKSETLYLHIYKGSKDNSFNLYEDDGATYQFEIDANHKERLLKGLDDIGLVMQNIKEIEAFEKKHHEELPWLA